MNFDPEMAKHRKNMSSRDQLLTPTSGMTEVDGVEAHQEGKLILILLKGYK